MPYQGRGRSTHFGQGGLPKRSYSKGQAKLNARRAMARGAGRMFVYRCPTCDGWHLGHRNW